MKILTIEEQLQVLEDAKQLAQINGLDVLADNLNSISNIIEPINDRTGYVLYLSLEQYKYINEAREFYKSNKN